MNENEMAMSCGVETFLHTIGLGSYAPMFLAKGYDRETDLQHLAEQDLDTMLITDPGHRRSLISAVRKHKPSNDATLLEWLREHELEHYFIGFVRSELIEMEEIAHLNLPDSNIYDELEISMPGHQRRLERAVRLLNKRRRHEEGAEVPVTEGFWGKPTNLEDAKYDFLCVEATISSTKDSSRSHTIDFMVDSGSDVTTLQEDLLYTLNPVLIGPINSKGVHSSKRKNLYKAKLTVGTQELEIEVMGEAYNSLGSRVLRHFRHYITGSKHIWLPGDYFDPVMTMGLKMLATEQNPITSGETTLPERETMMEPETLTESPTLDKLNVLEPISDKQTCSKQTADDEQTLGQTTWTELTTSEEKTKPDNHIKVSTHLLSHQNISSDRLSNLNERTCESVSKCDEQVSGDPHDPNNSDGHAASKHTDSRAERDERSPADFDISEDGVLTKDNIDGEFLLHNGHMIGNGEAS